MGEPRWPVVLFRAAQWTWPACSRREVGREAAETFSERLSQRLAAGRPWVIFALREVAGSLLAGLAYRRSSPVLRDSTLRRVNAMDTAWQDLRFALRALRRNRRFGVLVVLVLALGIGANTAIFSVVNAALLRPLPGAEPERLVTIRESNPEFDWVAQVAAPANMFDWRVGAPAFAEVAGHSDMGSVTMTGMGEPEIIRSVDVPGTFFDVFGVPAAHGRVLREEETWNTTPAVIVLSDGFWARRFGRDPSVLGRSLTLGGQTHEVVGIMPPAFTFPSDEVHVWRPMRWNPAFREQVFFRRAHWLNVVARLKPGVTVAEADAQLQVVVRRLARDYPQTNRVMGANVYGLHAFLVKEIRTPLLLLLGAVLLLLLIACANAGNLMLVRAAGRHRELAVRAALGAGRARVVRLVVTEGLVLALLGGVLGTMFGLTAVHALSGLMPATLPRLDGLGLGVRVLGFALSITLLSALLFGAIPGLRGARAGLADALRDGGRGASAGRASLRASNLLVMAETAIAVVLVLGAGLLVRSFVELRQVDPGFSLENRLTARVALPGSRYDTLPKVLNFYDALLERVRTSPGVLGAGMSANVPLVATGFTSSFVAEGWSPERFGAEVMHQRVTAGWFEVMNVRVLAGRLIERTDRSDTELVVLINETLRRQFFAGEDPLGRRIAFDREPGPDTRWWRIVGVLENIHQADVSAPPRIEVYHPVSQEPTSSMAITVHAALPPAAVTRIVRSAVAELDADIPLADVQTLDEAYARSLRQDRFLLTLLAGFAALALLLAALGVYGVASQAVRRRSQEIGIRVALGARRADVVRLILQQGIGYLAVGLALGMAGGIAVTRLMESVLFGIAPTDPITFVAVPLLLAIVAVLALLLPARGAARADPLVALRSDG